MTVQTAIRPQVMQRETFQAFIISSGPLSGVGKALPLEAADDLSGAVQIGTCCTTHKGHFMVRCEDTLTGKVLLKFYVVRKGKPVARYHEYATRLVSDRYAEHLFDLDAETPSVAAVWGVGK